MKVILSRKGFDSSYGEQPSPIMPDGTLISMPIPGVQRDGITYGELSYGGKSYAEILQELRPKTAIKGGDYSHLDPDLRAELRKRQPGWKGLYGQSGSAQGVLRKAGITTGDIFLFFGWFKETELKDGLLRYKAKAPDLHVIYGYLQIGAIYTNAESLPAHVKYHPHAECFTEEFKNNCVYEAAEQLSLNPALPGWGCLKLTPKAAVKTVLTKVGESRSRWDLPAFFKDVKITSHSADSFKDGYFKSVDRGQEFVIDSDAKVENWAKGLISSNYFQDGKNYGT